MIALREPLQSFWREVLHSAVVAEVIADRAAMMMRKGQKAGRRWYGGIYGNLCVSRNGIVAYKTSILKMI